MMTKNSFKPGRIYSIVYVGDVSMVQKRKFDGSAQWTDNPLCGAMVTVRRVSSLQAAGEKTWENYKRKTGQVTTTTQKPWCKVSPDNSCIMIGDTVNTMGKEYLRGLPRGITKEIYMINGIVATPAQVETIRKFKTSQGVTPYVNIGLDKIENIQTEEGESE